MPLSLVRYEAHRLPALRALLDDPGLAAEFEELRLPGVLEDWLRDSFRDREATRLAFVAGEAAGFCVPYVLPAATRPWGWLSIGVAERFRRRGLGTALVREAVAALTAPSRAPGLDEVCTSFWSPNPASASFAARHGFRRVRYSWRMERARGPIEPPLWPAGIEVRAFDGSDAALRDWNDVYNASFGEHYHYVASTVEHCRELVADTDFHADGLLLAYRDGRCVGFSRNWVNPARGEVATLGVDPQARGIGLGRALLRASVAWLERMDAPRVTLGVDGENETAIRLYRTEGFAVARTRETWGRAVPAPAP